MQLRIFHLLIGLSVLGGVQAFGAATWPPVSPLAASPSFASPSIGEDIVAESRHTVMAFDAATATLLDSSSSATDVDSLTVVEDVEAVAAVTGAPEAAPSGRGWRGTTGQAAYVRAAPSRSGPPGGELAAGQPVEITRWVSGEEVEKQNNVWAGLPSGLFIYSAVLRRAPLETEPELPADAPTTGRWIDVNLTQQVATAYDGRTPLMSVLISSGRPDWPTPAGLRRVGRRIAKETMVSASLRGLRLGPDGRGGASYRIENVRFTQYFTNDGAEIHENTWRRPALFGIPGSHGCIGMLPVDAAWFWEFATHGTPLLVHD